MWAKRAAALVGKIFRALVVAPGIARLESQAPDVDGVVFLKKTPRRPLPAVGTFAEVKLTAVRDYDFDGVTAPEGAAPGVRPTPGGRSGRPAPRRG